MNIVEKIQPKRKILGMSAILLPFYDDGRVDWDSFRVHLSRTLDAGLIPAVNMDTGYANLIDEETRLEVLSQTRELTNGKKFLGGAFVGDQPGDAFNASAYQSGCDDIQSHGGTPIIFQSFGMTLQTEDEILKAYQSIAKHCPEFYAFELGKMFAPFGSIYSLDLYRSIMEIPECLGAKHSSLKRNLEFQRLECRDQVRPDFKVLTGNDLAIDMVMYGSDYLLGLSSFAPDAFAVRDQYWLQGDERFYELNDLLQYLGCFAFRAPTSGYKHNCAQFLKLRSWLPGSDPHPKGVKRPDHDEEVLREICEKLDNLLKD